MSYQTIPCTNCKHPTRRKRDPVGVAPGSLVRYGDICSGCYNAGRVQKDYKKLSRERMAAEVVDIAHTISGLEGFMAERRARLARKTS